MSHLVQTAWPPSTGFSRIHRATLSPQDADDIYTARGFSGGDHDPAAMYEKIQRELLDQELVKPDRRSVNSLDRLPLHEKNVQSQLPPRDSRANALKPKTNLSQRSKKSVPKPSSLAFNKLPQVVFEIVLSQLQTLHDDKLAQSCSTCYMRDLVSLQLTNRAWDKAVRKRLYERICIAGTDSPQQLKRYKVRKGCRLRLLRRTLRERKPLANLVKELIVPDADASMQDQNAKVDPQFEEYRELIASVVMECPNLERLLGFYPLYNHEFDRLSYALSTRTKLKERVWTIAENKNVSYRAQCQLAPGLLDQLQVYQFLQYHACWTELETLMLHSMHDSGVLEEWLFIQTFQFLPKLRNLCVSNFDTDDFTDRVLLALPSLNCLRLENVRGVTDRGLSRWTTTPPAQSLQSLSLINQNVASIFAVSKILASLPKLLRFTLVQPDCTLELPSELIVIQPLLASPSLRKLHWDVTATPQPPNSTSDVKNLETANTYLALSIVHGGFPQLQCLRAPSDTNPAGALQAACRPVKDAQCLLPADRYSLPQRSRGPRSAMPEILPDGNSLHSARVRAQSYVDAAAKSPDGSVRVVITDHSDYETALAHSHSVSSMYTSTSSQDSGSSFSGSRPLLTSQHSKDRRDKGANMHAFATVANSGLKIHEFALPCFVGRVSTSAASFAPRPPKFDLRPDFPGHDADGGVVGWNDLLMTRLKSKLSRTGSKSGPAVIPVSPPKDACTGSWNRAHRRGLEWWRHIERDRQGESVEPMMLLAKSVKNAASSVSQKFVELRLIGSCPSVPVPSS